MTCIARWLIDNASSGLMSGTLVDDTGNGNTLTINNGNSDGSWTSVAAGNGFTANAPFESAGSMVCLLTDISANGNLGSALSGKTQATIRMVADMQNTGTTLFHIGTLAGNGDIKISVGNLLNASWDRENTGGYLNFNPPSGLGVIDVVFDSTQAVADDRIKVYYNGEAQTRTGGVPPAQNTALTSVNNANRYMALFNRPNQNRNAMGSLYYAELHDTALTPAEISTGVPLLLANNDADWAANQEPVLNEDLTTIQIQEGQTGTISANVTDANVGETLTFTITPDISAVSGFTFNTSNGDIVYDGSQSAAASVEYTRRATDTGGLFVEDTFTIEVIPPSLTIDSVSDLTPQPGDEIDITHSNALDDLTAGDYTVVSNAPGTTRVLIPNPITFVLTGQTYPTLNFNTPVNIPLTDGTNSDDAALNGIEPPTGTEFAEITSIPANSIYAATPAIQVGHFGHFFNITGNWVIDPATGVVIVDAAGGSFEYTVYNGEWAAPVTHTVAARPSGTVTIDSLVPGREGAVVNFSYPGSDLTGFQYRIDGGSWQAATSPLNITGLTFETQYLFEITAVNNGRQGDITSQTFTTTAAVDASPNTFTFAAQSGVARGVYVTSNAITVQGVDAGVDIPVTVSGGEYSVSTDNGQTWGVFTTTPTNVRLNYQIRVRHMSASGYNAQRTTGLNVGDKVGYFISTTLVDAVAPVISLTGGNMSIVQGTAFVEPGYSAIDNADGDISVSGVVVTGSVNTNVPGTYTLTYTATDAAGNSASTTRIVTVTPFVPADTQAPVISLVGGNITLNEGDTWSEPGYSATDNVDGNITNSVTVSGSVNTSVPGTYTLTYSATDAAGNTGSVSRTVIVLAAVQYPISSPAPSSRTFVAERVNRVELGEEVFLKQPDEILDYDFDLSPWLASQGDTLQSDNFSVDVGGSDISVVGAGKVPGTDRIKVWIAGGSPGKYTKPVELTIITAGFRKAQFIIRIVVIDRVA